MCRGMKESGIEWIGEIPEQWSVRKYKSICNIYAGGTPDTNKLEFWNGDIPWLPSGKIKNDDIYEADKFITNLGLEKSSTKLIKENTTLLAMTGATCGNVGFLRIKSCANQSVMAFENLNKSFLDRFIYYTLLSQREAILLQKTGGAQSGINVEDGKNLFLPSCSYITQEKIVNYLDKKVSQVDDIISKQKILIEKYKSYKQSLITETVTKGLNNNVPMKDSGIEWIGEIPKEWNIDRIKTYFDIILGATPKSDNYEYWNGDITWITPADYKTEDIYIRTSKRNISTSGLNSCSTRIVPKGSIIVSSRAPIGLVGISDIDLCTNQGCKSLVNKSGIYISNKFVYYYISVMTEVLNIYGKGTTFLELSSFDLNNFKIIIPTIEQQKEIVKFLDSKCTEIDSTISKKEELIEKLESYKKSLIYECVTGKREVN
ncbi:restriction endonuclease subunit S [Clostridium celatum]|uniref:restriction endonuclease subunit S n=1 Tax=Clostridium celatum TaxID=36834 RepID=UPI001F260123|nr:restriction endonuclease subunit S [Clostridium celatum]MCE9656259.1 restriction endonuclease subunit S [Clostridium celatum]